MKTDRFLLPSGMSALSLALMLGSCGGHHDDSATATQPSTPAAPVTPADPASDLVMVQVHVFDDDYTGAIGCADLNRNSVCDAGEPQGVSDANGMVTMFLTRAQQQSAPIAVEVPIGATMGGKPVTVPTYMTAPAGSTQASPSTTLVEVYKYLFPPDPNLFLDDAAQTERARKLLMNTFSQYGLTIDPLGDYTKKNDKDSKTLANIARTLTIIKEYIVKDIGPRIDARELVNKNMAIALGTVLTELTKPKFTEITDESDLAFELLSLAIVVYVDIGLNGDNLEGILDSYERPILPPPAPGTPTRTLRYLSYVSPTQYDYSLYEQTAQQNTLDSFAQLHFTVSRRRAGPDISDVGTPVLNTSLSDFFKSFPIVWSGTQWVDCGANFVHDKTAQNAAGLTTFTYCKNYSFTLKTLADGTTTDLRGVTFKQAAVLLADLTKRDITDDRSRFPGIPSTIAYPLPISWNAGSIPPSAAFGPGSKIVLYRYKDLVAPPYSYSSTDKPRIFDTTNPSACAAGNAAAHEVASLEELLIVKSGSQCANGPFAGTSNYAVLSLTPGTRGLAANSISAIFSSPNTENGVTYYRCDANARCTALGKGFYLIKEINASGDRALVFTEPPPEAEGRIFVQRGNNVYYGVRQTITADDPVFGLNEQATAELLTRLGLQ